MRRLLTAAIVAFAGCGTVLTPTGEPTQILTDAAAYAGTACSRGHFLVGKLIVDPEYGTALDFQPNFGRAPPVVWRVGFTARRAGSEVDVLGPDGAVIATTGKWYRLAGGFLVDESGQEFDGRVIACGVSPHAPVLPPELKGSPAD